MKILIEGRTLLNNAGTAIYTKELVKALVSIDKRNKYIFAIPESSEFSTTAKNLKIIKISGKGLFNRIKWYFYLQKIIMDNKPDIIHFTKGSSIKYDNIKIVNTIHDIFPVTNPKYFSFFEKLYWKYSFKKAVNNSDKILTVSNFSKDEIIKKYNVDKNKVSVIYNGLPEIQKVKAKDITLPEKYILFIGRVQKRKNLHKIIEAFNHLAAEDSEIHLVIAGTIPSEGKYIYNCINRSQYRKRIVSLGYVESKYIPVLYTKAQFLAFPSLVEGFGIPIIEAQGYGCPVLTSEAASMPEIGSNGAIYCNPNNTSDIFYKMRALLSNKPLQQNLIKNGMKNIKKYSWIKSAKETLSIYSDLLHE